MLFSMQGIFIGGIALHVGERSGCKPDLCVAALCAMFTETCGSNAITFALHQDAALTQLLSSSFTSCAGHTPASQHKHVLCASQITFGLGAALRAGFLNAKSVKILRSAAILA